MKRLIATTCLMAISMSAHAVPIAGYSDITNNGGGSYTFTFDTLPGPDIVNSDGLTFSGFGIGLTVTGSGDVIQDVPANGGLGVDGGAFGDNMGGGEWLAFTFNQSIDLLGISLNGLMQSDGHTDAADGRFSFSTGGTNILAAAANYDGVGTEVVGDIVDNFPAFANINTFNVSSKQGSWHGYVESITVRTSQVPEPSVLALLGTGLLGLWFTRRRKSGK